MKVKKSICIEMLFTEVPFKDRFQLTRESGFEYIEFWSWKDKDIQMIKELCRTYDLKIASFSGDQEFSMIDENQKEDYIAFVNESMETAKFLNCPHLVIHSNALDENGVVKNHYDNVSNSKKNAVMFDVLSDLAPAAKKANIILVLEALNTVVDHAGYFLASAKAAVELIRSVNASHIKVLYDLYHMQIMEGNITTTLKEYMDAIGYIHIADAPGRHEPGTGQINFTAVMNTLKELKYDGMIGFELAPLQDSKKAIDRIKSL